jgi:hypothetical protein
MRLQTIKRVDLRHVDQRHRIASGLAAIAQDSVR